MQIGQHEVFLQVIVKTRDFLVAARHLEIDRKHRGRQQTLKPIGLSFCLGESGTLVQARITQKLVACAVNLLSGHLDLLWVFLSHWVGLLAHATTLSIAPPLPWLCL